MTIVDQAKKAAAAAGLARVAFSLVVTVEGAPIRERDKPAAVKLFGVTVFDRDAAGRQHLGPFRMRNARR